MRFDYVPGKPCGYWQYDGGESWFDDFEEAEAAARIVLSQMEAAELSAMPETE